MKFRGAGTEQIERALHAILPEIRTIRVDADTTRHKGSHQKLLRDFATGKADVLLGTQMIAKGLHFPEVTLVGVLNSDAGLSIPDFRASETVFQLITQVAGRAGRGLVPGEVIVQTCLMDNSTIKLAAAQDYQKFFEDEISIRQMFDFPPFTQLVKLTFSGPNERQTAEIAESFRQKMGKFLASSFILNPIVPSGHAKVKDNFRFQFLVRGPHIYSINRSIEETKKELALPQSIHLLIDVNPLSTFF
jgi:primosomal protein N' (replication factor Y)